MKYVCVHGHFYQPPRENPWLEDIEIQDSAHPYHDWNERINNECYAPNSAARILGEEEKIVDIINNYERISFNFGPTLLHWMKNNSPETYQKIIEADREKVESSGYGSAIAQAHNHMIMPLANRRDKETQVLWGIRDFEYRFGRKPEGMWLPETAVDTESLEIMAENGIKFTILSPHQAGKVRKMGEEEWKELNGDIDPKKPYLYRLPSGKTISLFFYDGPISHDIAFGDMLKDGEAFANRLLNAFTKDKKASEDEEGEEATKSGVGEESGEDQGGEGEQQEQAEQKEQEGQKEIEPQVVHIATDGETFGHHHRYGEMALAYCLQYIDSKENVEIVNYSEYLEEHPPVHEVKIVEDSSWSCIHGVERWRDNCGCNTGMNPGWQQKWRKPLREAMNWLRDELAAIYEKESKEYFDDPWKTRNDYIWVVLDRDITDQFLGEHGGKELSPDDKVKLLKLLEMQRHAMLMFTSCGWFFDEISGIETVQVIQYAARAMQLAKEVSGKDLEPEYLKFLEKAPSNISEIKDGSQVYEMFVRPAALDLLRVAAHYALSSLFEEYPETARIYCYTVENMMYDLDKAGVQKLALGESRIKSVITREEDDIIFAALHMGNHTLWGGVSNSLNGEEFKAIQEKMKESFSRGNIPEVIQAMDEHFGTHSYTIWHLFKDEQRKILSQIIGDTMEDIEGIFREIYEHNYPVMQVMKGTNMPIPKAIRAPVELVLDIDLRKMLEEEAIDLEELQKLVEEIRKWDFEVDKVTTRHVLSQKITDLMKTFQQDPHNRSWMEQTVSLIKILKPLNLGPDLWEAQNLYFSIGKQIMQEMRQREDEEAKEWLELFDSLGDYMGAKVT
ncbi:MAG: DUF3536 domain-containing protein [Archaeoglobaceae archaeon]